MARQRSWLLRQWQAGRYQSLFNMAIRRGLGNAVGRRRGGILAAGLAIVIVIGNDGRHIDVAAGRMDEVVAADGRAVAVTHGDKDIEVRIAKGNPGCGRKARPCVTCMQLMSR